MPTYQDLYAEEASTASTSAGLDVVDQHSLIALQALLPPGVAWPRDADADLTSLLEALSYEFSRIKQRALDLLAEVDPSTCTELLADFERVFGLPSACAQPTTLEGRRAALLGRILGYGSPTPAYLLQIAASIGQVGTITEHRQSDNFNCDSPCNAPLYNEGWLFVWDYVATTGDLDGQVRCALQEVEPDHTLGRFFYDLTWATQTSGTANTLYAVAYGMSRFVAVGFSGTILTSSDGTTWTPRTSGSAEVLQGIAFANDLWVVVGSNGTILTSPDGLTWTPRTSGVATDLAAVVYDQGLWVVVGTAPVILTSPDGVTWTPQTVPNADGINDVATNGHKFVAAQYSGKFLTSSDGLTWTPHTTGTGFVFIAVAWCGDVWIASAGNGVIYSSPDGITWTRRYTEQIDDYLHIAVAPDRPLAVMVNDLGQVTTTWNGLNFRTSDTGANTALLGIAFGNSVWVAVGQGGVIVTSQD